ncbi:basigin-like isoform X1 [Biomphalaria glabrata]|nr:basigin-like isoform X1 [Biomphalaria glabrata]KAI8777694.1 basigin isoform X1 [Biomphalaria glabrata]
MALYFELFVVLLGLSLIHGETVNSIVIYPKEETLLYRNGTMVVLSCQVRSKENGTELKWEGSVVMSTINSLNVDPETKDELLTNNLTITSFKSVNSGVYTCKHVNRNAVLSQASRTLKLVTETKEGFTFNEANKTESANLSCNINLPNVKNVTWIKNNIDLSDKSHYIEENNTLTIKNPERKHAGTYIARFFIEGSSDHYDCEVDFTAPPHVDDFEKAKNLIQDDNMELQCKVQGFPHAVVTWYKDDIELNVTEGGRVTLMPLNGYKNAHLKIKSVEFSDAGEYECKAYSAYFDVSSSKKVTVRVKDKLAALWPFLGIVGEVIILCTIIFIYEKRRNKRAEQEEINAQEADDAISDKKDGLRHRNTTSNNPTA